MILKEKHNIRIKTEILERVWRKAGLKNLRDPKKPTFTSIKERAYSKKNKT